MLSAKRMREHAALFAALLGVVALVSGLSVGVLGYVARSADEGIRSGLAARTGSDRAYRVALPLAEDAAAQDAAVRRGIDEALGGQPADVHRTISGKVDVNVIVGGVQQLSRRSILLSIADLADVADLVDGTWPGGPEQVTLQATGAERLGVATGDRILIDDTVVDIVGTWQVRDKLDPRWMGELLITEGTDELDAGPIVIDEALWPRVDVDPRVRWTVVPGIETMTAGQLATIVDSWDRIGTTWRQDLGIPLTGLEKGGRFKRTALELGSRVDALQAIEPVVLLLLAAIALVTLAELGRLLTTTRSDELALLWSRGASAADLGRATAGEVAIAAGAGAALGTAGALGVLMLLTGPEASQATGAALVIVPIVVTAAAVAMVAGSAWRSGRRQTVRDPSDAAGRSRRLAGPGAVLLTAGAAALAVWQLQLYGSPLTPSREGGTDVDPIAVLAPALTLVAIVLLALVLFPRVARLAEAATRRAPITRILAARTVARRVALVAAPIVVVAVTCATIVIAAGYARTWSTSFERTSELRTGAEIHATSGLGGLRAGALDALAALDAVDGVAPVDLQTLQLGTDTGSLVAVSPPAFRDQATTASGALDTAAVADAFRVELPGPAIPAGAASVQLTATSQGFAVPPAVTLLLEDRDGVLRSVPLEDLDDVGPDPVGEVAGRMLRS